MTGGLNEVGAVERHFGIVTRLIGAPGKLGRIFFQSDTLTGDSEWPTPAMLRFPHAGAGGDGMFWVPMVGDLVEIELDVANELATPRIIGMGYSSEDEPQPVFASDYPFVRGWASRVGHAIAWSINPINKFLRILHPSGSGFEWDNGGNELHVAAKDVTSTTIGDTTIARAGTSNETYVKEVSRNYVRKTIDKYFDEHQRDAIGAVKDRSKTGYSAEVPGNTAVRLTPGKVAIGSGAVELIDQQIKQLNALIVAPADTGIGVVLTRVGPADLNSTVVGALKGVRDALVTIKGSL